MKIALAVSLLLFSSLAHAQDEEKLSIQNWGSSAVMSVQSLPKTMWIGGSNGKHATIDFDGDKVIYSGDLPVDEAAKTFFEAVMKQMKTCPP